MIVEYLKLDIPTAIPLVYEFDANMNVIRDYYIADDEDLEYQINRGKQNLKVDIWMIIYKANYF